MSGRRAYALTAVVTGLGVGLAACGGSGGGGSTSAAGVQSCLQNAGYGVTVVPASQVTGTGPENRGPGQTGELLVGRQGAKPTPDSDNADAVVAFWKTAKLAQTSPNAQDKGLGTHADALGAVTVQPTTHLLLYVIHAAGTPAARRALYQAQIKKLESCVS